MPGTGFRPIDHVKLFQIEEPEGGPSHPDAPGAAIGVDASGTCAKVALSVGGNAIALADREGFERPLPVPAITADAAAWQTLFEGARLRAERALGRPATHAAIALGVAVELSAEHRIRLAAGRAGLE